MGVASVDLPALREALKKMTPGPLAHDTYRFNQGTGDKWRGIVGGEGELVVRVGDCGEHDGVFLCQQDSANLDAIVALVNAAPALLDELEQARAEIEALELELAEAGKSLGLEIAQLRAELGEMDVRLAGVEAERDAARVALANVQADLAEARADYYRLKRILQVAHGALADAGVPGLLIPGAFDDPLAPTIAQLCADLVVARTALDSIESLPAGGSVLVVEDGTHRFVTIDRAAWQAWQAAKGTR